MTRQQRAWLGAYGGGAVVAGLLFAFKLHGASLLSRCLGGAIVALGVLFVGFLLEANR